MKDRVSRVVKGVWKSLCGTYPPSVSEPRSGGKGFPESGERARRPFHKAAVRALAVVAVVGWAFTASAAYVPVEWIKANGKQWIYTEYVPKCTDKVEIKIKTDTVGTTHGLWCSRGTTSSTATFTGFLSSTKKFLFHRNANTNNNYSDDTVAAKTDYVVTADGNTLVCTVNGKEVSAKMESGTFTPSNAFSLFATYTATSLDPANPPKMDNFGTYTLYYFRVYDKDGNLVRQYIPARDDSVSSGTAQYGLYETETQTFCPGLGSGSFTAGGEGKYRWDAEMRKVECRVIVETEGSGTVKIGDGEWTTAATNWVEFASAPTCTISASPADGSAFICWKIGTGESSTAQPLERTISGPTVIRAVFRDEAAMNRWIYLPSAQSGGAGSAVISNAVSHTVLKVTVSGTNLTISGIFKNGDDLTDGAKTLDLSTPVESLDYVTQYAITAIKASTISPLFRSGAENLYLPETLTEIESQFIDCHTTKSSIRRVRLPSSMTDLSSASWAFRGCTNLLEVLPAGVLESGRITAYATSIFYNCTSLTNCPNLVNAVKAPETFMYSCKSAVGNPHIENLETISSGAFNG